LPPLPPLPRGAGDEVRPGGQGMPDLLDAQHRTLIGLCTRPAALVAAASRHLSAERQYLYPTVRAVLPDGARLAATGLAADAALQRALRADPDQVVPALRRHLDWCAQVLPRLAAALTGTELVRLGNRVQIATEAGPTRPHPAAPATPPWNKLVDPAVGVVDRVRDLLTGRTFPSRTGRAPDRKAKVWR
jgi:hypothetical protein